MTAKTYYSQLIVICMHIYFLLGNFGKVYSGYFEQEEDEEPVHVAVKTVKGNLK